VALAPPNRRPRAPPIGAPPPREGERASGRARSTKERAAGAKGGAFVWRCARCRPRPPAAVVRERPLDPQICKTTVSARSELPGSDRCRLPLPRSESTAVALAVAPGEASARGYWTNAAADPSRRPRAGAAPSTDRVGGAARGGRCGRARGGGHLSRFLPASDFQWGKAWRATQNCRSGVLKPRWPAPIVTFGSRTPWKGVERRSIQVLGASPPRQP